MVVINHKGEEKKGEVVVECGRGWVVEKEEIK